MNEHKQAIHDRAVLRGVHFKRSESDIILSLQEVQESLLFLDFKLDSLHQYAMKYIGLSENVAGNFILVARKAALNPELKEALFNGNISVCKIRKAASMLTLENSEEWPLWIEKLKRIQDLESKRTGRSVKMEDVLEASFEAYLEKYDPVRKAERVLSRKAGHAE